MKNYSQDVINNIQQAIDAKNYELVDITSFEEMPNNIRLNGITVRLLSSESGLHDAMLYMDDTFDRADGVTFKHEALGKFYTKDWKRANKGIETFKYYKIFSASIKDVEVRMLIRDTSDVEYTEEDEPDYYADIRIDNIPYAIIKAYCPAINENFAVKSLFDEQVFVEKIISSFGTIIDDTANYNGNESDDVEDYTPESEELF